MHACIYTSHTDTHTHTQSVHHHGLRLKARVPQTLECDANDGN